MPDAKERYPHKILIIEDEQAMRESLADNLIAAGFENVLTGRDGAEGLSAAERMKPDLVLLDIVLPKMDGMTVLKKLRELPGGKELKVIMLTNLTADDSIMKGVVEGEPSYYMIKAESSIDSIIEKVKNVLGLQ